jgi:hypothetical protein
VNDRLAVIGPNAVKGYFTGYKNLSAMLSDGCPLHPESMVAASLRLNGCIIREELMAEFSTLRWISSTLDKGMKPPCGC